MKQNVIGRYNVSARQTLTKNRFGFEIASQNVIARHEAKRHCEARSKTSLRGTKQNVIARNEAKRHCEADVIARHEARSRPYQEPVLTSSGLLPTSFLVVAMTQSVRSKTSLRGGRHCEERSKKQTQRRTGFNEFGIASHFVPCGRNDAKRMRRLITNCQYWFRTIMITTEVQEIFDNKTHVTIWLTVIY